MREHEVSRLHLPGSGSACLSSNIQCSSATTSRCSSGQADVHILKSFNFIIALEIDYEDSRTLWNTPVQTISLSKKDVRRLHAFAKSDGY